MARVSAILFAGRGMTPCGSGWKVDGLFFSTWSAAATYLHNGEVPSAEQVEEWEDDSAGHRMERNDTRGEQEAERRMRQV